jgi:hypothetical protein
MMLTETKDRADVIGLSALSQKIEQWRSQKPRSRSMPEALWQEASEAARNLGVSRVATALKVGYATLRQRSGVEGVRKAARRPEPSVPLLESQFVELSDLSPIRDEAIVEVTVPDGTRLTIRLKGSTNVVALVNALRWRA